MITLELVSIILNLLRLILSGLCAYYHFNQYNGTSAVLADFKMKESHELEMIYMDPSTSTVIILSMDFVVYNIIIYKPVYQAMICFHFYLLGMVLTMLRSHSINKLKTVGFKIL